MESLIYSTMEKIQFLDVTDERTHLYMIADIGDSWLFCQLACGGVDVNATDGYGSTALHLAVLKVRHKIVAALLLMGANANCKDGNGQTPLHTVISSWEAVEDGENMTAAPRSH